MGGLKVIDGKENQKKSAPIKDASDVHKIMRFLENEDRENLYILCLSAKNYVTHIELITIGTLTNSLIHPREVYKPTIKNNSASIIVVHNHPSGDPAPSREDIEVSIRLVNVGQIIGIPLRDHVIIGKDSYFSMAEKNIVGFNQQGKAGLIAQGDKEHSIQRAEEMYHKLDYARNDILHELFKLETAIKLGDAESIRDRNSVRSAELFRDSDSDTEEGVNWTYVFSIINDIKDKAIEKVQTLEGLISDFRTMFKKLPGQNIEREIV